MALICYNRAKECDGCGYCFDYDPYEIEDDNIDDLFDKNFQERMKKISKEITDKLIEVSEAKS